MIDFSSLFPALKEDKTKVKNYSTSFPKLFRFNYDLEAWNDRKHGFDKSNWNATIIGLTIESAEDDLRNRLRGCNVIVHERTTLCDRIDCMTEEMVEMILNTNKHKLNVKPIEKKIFPRLDKPQDIPNSIKVRDGLFTNSTRVRTNIPKDKGNNNQNE